MLKQLRKVLVVLLVVVCFVAFAGCKTSKKGVGEYTYKTYLSVSPSNWNELTYQDNNDTEVLNWIKSGFYEYDFAYDASGNIVNGEFEIVPVMADGAPVDVTSQYVGQFGIEAGEKARVWQFNIRHDLVWEDGSPIKAADFVYTMKEQLNPLFQHYRADSYYVGASVIHNAENYVKQGQTVFLQNAADGATQKYQIADLVKGEDGVYALPNGRPIKFALYEELEYAGGSIKDYASYLDEASYNALVKLADKDGRVDVTDETIALVKTLIDTPNWGNEDETCIPYYLVYENEFAAMDFSEVGFKATGDYQLTVVYDNPLALLEDDGTMSYNCAYSFGGFPLVKEDLYEASKVAPVEGSTLWTTTYHTTLNSTLSYGPYKLKSFQSGKEFVFVKNENWFGYKLDQYEGQYQTTKIEYAIIEEWNTAWQLFQKGQLSGIGIDVSIASDYKGSQQAYFTPDDFVSSLQLQSSEEGLAKRESEGVNKTILTYVEFRKALALGFSRADYTTTCTTSSLPGFGLFNSMHYYDVAHGGVYRNTEPAKKTLCEVYGVDYNQFESLDAAVNYITGYDLTQARQLVNEAYDKAVADGKLKTTDKVELVMGTSTDNESTRRTYEFFKKSWTDLMVGTKLEGKFELKFSAEFGDAWANDFRAGAYDVCTGGWTGAAWNPGYFLLAYLSPSYMYSTAWKTNEQTLEFTMPGAGENGADITDTLTLMGWYNCLNNASGCKYRFGQGSIEEEKRLLLIAALEQEVLKVYYSVPIANRFAASLRSFQIEYATYDYNTFMAYGGVQYYTYSYDDYEWSKFIKKNNGTLNYK